MNIRCDEWECANNGGGYCELGDTDFTPLVIVDGECKSYEAKGDDGSGVGQAFSPD